MTLRNLSVVLFLYVSPVTMAASLDAMPHTFSSNTPAIANQVNQNFDAIREQLNDNAAQIAGKQASVSDSCTSGSSIRVINSDGTVVCEQDDTGPLDQSKLDEIYNAIYNVIPAGVVLAYMGKKESVPDGWLLCDGTAVDRVEFSRLFAAIGVSHGGGDGVSTFNLPDMQGRFLRGVDDGKGRDRNAAARGVPQPGGLGGEGNSGDEVGSIQADSTARPKNGWTVSTNGNHSHTFQTRQDDFNVSGGNGPSFGADNGNWRNWGTNTTGNHSHSVTGGDAETRPVNINVHWIIKY